MFLKSIATSFTPTTDLFDDGSEISFVSYFFGMQSNQKQGGETIFCLPKNTVEKFDMDKTYIVVSGVIKPLCSGKVIDVGFDEHSQKYIKIEHANNYFTKYIGLSNVGVAMGDSVNIDSPIGISEKETKIYIENKNNLLKLSEVQWKD